MAKYRDLIVFQKADELAFSIYKATETFPKSETFVGSRDEGQTCLLQFAAVDSGHEMQLLLCSG